ncbi:hypothetical protein EMPS_04294 [Entomortierella parvispora]|uniref:Uncharacterized protein n=1 Tax=Entomortierella parvispora TaxID=205924 RepID=A0A9P3H8E5_9FUNG|nr:hypothetical protein EMPS_04294 [Entomortierella parvispora]
MFRSMSVSRTIKYRACPLDLKIQPHLPEQHPLRRMIQVLEYEDLFNDLPQERDRVLGIVQRVITQAIVLQNMSSALLLDEADRRHVIELDIRLDHENSYVRSQLRSIAVIRQGEPLTVERVLSKIKNGDSSSNDYGEDEICEEMVRDKKLDVLKSLARFAKVTLDRIEFHLALHDGLEYTRV